MSSRAYDGRREHGRDNGFRLRSAGSNGIPGDCQRVDRLFCTGPRRIWACVAVLRSLKPIQAKARCRWFFVSSTSLDITWTLENCRSPLV